MTKRLLTDAELRAAAALRPGYATYPEYRPGQPERLGLLPAVDGSRRGSTVALGFTAAPEVPAAPAPGIVVLAARLGVEHCAHVAATELKRAQEVLDARPPVPAAEPVAVTLVALPESPVFDFQPCLISERPWWRRRWHWAVMAVGARTYHGYAWTEAGARRRTARAARRAAR
ncbi:hypothetical protein [Micromonospora sp. RTP1Z1]|uniref:hypothetical protein n=1 Tax=Micromonospora sp. RTP1Z1 TaxID=2994043 RepID=UPI0029C8AB2C|nr:hypothetical protein [Micromonospora sp. RTP1Z1]